MAKITGMSRNQIGIGTVTEIDDKLAISFNPENYPDQSKIIFSGTITLDIQNPNIPWSVVTTTGFFEFNKIIKVSDKLVSMERKNGDMVLFYIY